MHYPREPGRRLTRGSRGVLGIPQIFKTPAYIEVNGYGLGQGRGRLGASLLCLMLTKRY